MLNAHKCLYLCAALAAAVVSSLSAVAAEDEPDAGFVELFNGKDFDGWNLKIRRGGDELARKVFSAVDGVVHVFRDFPKDYELNAGKNHTHSLMYTKKSYDKFIFRFE